MDSVTLRAHRAPEDPPTPAVRGAAGSRWRRRAAIGANDVDPDVSFEDLYARHHRDLLALAGLLCGDRDDAEDIVADVLARAYPQWRKGNIDDPGAYLRRAVVNEVRSRWRKLAVRRRVHNTRRGGEPRDAPAADTGLADHQRLQAALLALPDRQRAAVVLRFYDDRSEADTAAILGVPVGTVKSSVARGLRRLAALLGEGDGEGEGDGDGEGDGQGEGESDQEPDRASGAESGPVPQPGEREP